MPKRSDFAIALGLGAPPSPAINKHLDRPDRAAAPQNAAEGFYFQLETFLDNWRRHGVAEEVVRAALERAKQTSLAMETIGQWLERR